MSTSSHSLSEQREQLRILVAKLQRITRQEALLAQKYGTKHEAFLAKVAEEELVARQIDEILANLECK